MTFESLVVMGLSIGLSYSDILNMKIGLILGICNEKNNQIIEMNKQQQNKREDVIQGNAEMLMKM